MSAILKNCHRPNGKYEKHTTWQVTMQISAYIHFEEFLQ